MRKLIYACPLNSHYAYEYDARNRALAMKNRVHHHTTRYLYMCALLTLFIMLLLIFFNPVILPTIPLWGWTEFSVCRLSIEVFGFIISIIIGLQQKVSRANIFLYTGKYWRNKIKTTTSFWKFCMFAKMTSSWTVEMIQRNRDTVKENENIWQNKKKEKEEKKIKAHGDA